MGFKLNRLAQFAGRLRAPTIVPLSGRQLSLVRAGVLLVFALTIGLFSVSIPAYYDSFINLTDPGDLELKHVQSNLQATGISVDFYATYLISIHTASTVLWSAVAAVIFWRRSDEGIALLTSLSLLTFGVFFLNDGHLALTNQYPAMWLPINLLAVFGSASFYLFFYLFPNGRFVPRWMFWVPVLWAAHEAAYYLLPDYSIFSILHRSSLLDSLIILTFFCIGIGSQLYRYRRVSSPVQRQQTKWVVFGMVLAGLGTAGFGLLFRSLPQLAQTEYAYVLLIFVLQIGILGSMLLIPLSIGVAILRYRLWDVDVVINRTLVYGVLTVTVVGAYVFVVVYASTLLQTGAGGNLVISVLATGLVAVLFQPLYNRLQRVVNRLMYGERDDPYGVLSHLGRRLEGTLEPKAVLPTIVDTVAGALKLPYAAIAMRQEDGYEVAAARGSPTGEEIVLPLTYAGKSIGRLILAPRAPGEPFAPADRRLLEDLSRQAEVAVQAVKLNADLQRSREQLVSAREEERRRLRRDLHDGLGPTLATLILGLDVSLQMLENDSQDAGALLRELKSQARGAVVDIRRLVHGLRPPSLDDLGLVATIREQASKYGYLADAASITWASGVASKDGLVFSVEAPEKLPPLPAAVEVACYRIAQEGMNNVVRHAEARTCRVRLSIDDVRKELVLEVADDGVGLPEGRRAGVGMSSMAERAAELGGTCVVAPNPMGGTRVLARLPLFAEVGE